MPEISLIRKNGFRYFDLILILGIILAPMTEMRLWKMGPSEILCFIWCTRYLHAILHSRLGNFLTAFWIGFFLTITAGTFFCMAFYPGESTGIPGLLTWFFLMYFSLGMYYGLSRRTIPDILRIARNIIFGSVLWNAFLLFYHNAVSPYFLGARIFYAGVRYAGGASNPHQVAILSLGMLFLSLYFIFRVKLSRLNQVLFAGCAGFYFYIILLTRSTTALMAMVAAGALLAFILVYRAKKSTRGRQLIIVVTLLAAVVVLFFGYVFLFDAFINWVASDSNGLGRFELFSYILDPVAKNPLFGLGDGTHSNGGISEFHNSYFEIIAMSGLVGVVLFAWFTVKLVKVLRVDPVLLVLSFAMYIYGLAGFGLRRMPYWALTTICILLAEKLKRQNLDTDQRIVLEGKA